MPVKLDSLLLNPKNPRVIKDEKFKKLTQSIKDFPIMMELRPIIIDENSMILGGNMRFKALQELGYDNIPDAWVKRADELTEDQKKEFIIKDNVGFGEWDFEALANEWDVKELTDWGLELPNFSAGVEENNMTEDDIDMTEEFDPYGIATNLQKVVFIFDNEEAANEWIKTTFPEGLEYTKHNMKTYRVNLSSTYGDKK